MKKSNSYEDLKLLFKESKNAQYWLRFLRLEKQKQFKNLEENQRLKKG